MLFAREYLKTVNVSEKQVERLATEAARGGCQGHRAELFATRVAKASAALDARALTLPYPTRPGAAAMRTRGVLHGLPGHMHPAL